MDKIRVKDYKCPKQNFSLIINNSVSFLLFTKDLLVISYNTNCMLIIMIYLI